MTYDDVGVILQHHLTNFHFVHFEYYTSKVMFPDDQVKLLFGCQMSWHVLSWSVHIKWSSWPGFIWSVDMFSVDQFPMVSADKLACQMISLTCFTCWHEFIGSVDMFSLDVVSFSELASWQMISWHLGRWSGDIMIHDHLACWHMIIWHIGI